MIIYIQKDGIKRAATQAEIDEMNFRVEKDHYCAAKCSVEIMVEDLLSEVIYDNNTIELSDELENRMSLCLLTNNDLSLYTKTKLLITLDNLKLQDFSNLLMAHKNAVIQAHDNDKDNIENGNYSLSNLKALDNRLN